MNAIENPERGKMPPLRRSKSPLTECFRPISFTAPGLSLVRGGNGAIIAKKDEKTVLTLPAPNKSVVP